jgi:hypothetical protein
MADFCPDAKRCHDDLASLRQRGQHNACGAGSVAYHTKPEHYHREQARRRRLSIISA